MRNSKQQAKNWEIPIEKSVAHDKRSSFFITILRGKVIVAMIGLIKKYVTKLIATDIIVYVIILSNGFLYKNLRKTADNMTTQNTFKTLKNSRDKRIVTAVTNENITLRIICLKLDLLLFNFTYTKKLHKVIKKYLITTPIISSIVNSPKGI